MSVYVYSTHRRLWSLTYRAMAPDLWPHFLFSHSDCASARKASHIDFVSSSFLSIALFFARRLLSSRSFSWCTFLSTSLASSHAAVLCSTFLEFVKQPWLLPFPCLFSCYSLWRACDLHFLRHDWISCSWIAFQLCSLSVQKWWNTYTTHTRHATVPVS